MENLTIFPENKPQHHLMGNRILLFASYILNAGAIFSHISPWIKGLLVVLSVLTTIMAFFNQFKTFKKNFKTTWIIVKVTHFFTYMTPKKNRHLQRGIRINKTPKTKKDEIN